jgi:hypothetical protein
LAHGARLFRGDAIITAVRRQSQSRARLGQRGLNLLHAQFVILLFKLGDNLSLPHRAAQINRNCLQATGHFCADGDSIISGQAAIDGHRFAYGHLGDLCGFDLSRR